MPPTFCDVIYPVGRPTVERLGTHLRAGTQLDMIPHRTDGALVDEAEMQAWGADHDVDADVLRELLRGRGVFGEPDPRGLRLRGVRIRGRLDLDRVRTTIALRLTDCLLEHGVTAGGASLADLELNRCRLAHPTEPAIGGAGLHVEGSLWVVGSTVAGGIDLTGARISGRLLATHSTVDGAAGLALCADGMRTGGDVLLGEGFRAAGAVRLRRAEIGGTLHCRGALLRNPSGPALDAEGLRTAGDLVLDDGFTATGAIRLVGARVGGRLHYRGAVVRRGSDPSHRWSVDGLVYSGAPIGADPAWDCASWLQLLRTATPAYAAQPYRQLAAAYREQGDDGAVRAILVAQRRDHLARGALSRRDRCWGHVTGWLLGYGYRSWRVLWGLLGVVAASVLLALLLGPAGALGRIPDTPVAATPAPCTVVETIGNGLGAPFLAAPVPGPRSCAPLTTPAGDVLTVATWVLRLIAWALAALFVAGLTGIVRRA